MRKRFKGAAFVVLALALVAVVASAASGGTDSKKARQAIVLGGTVRYAEPVGKPDWIFPIEPAANQTFANGQFIPLMWKSLYDVGSRGEFRVEPDIGMARLPVFGDGGKTVTITLKPWVWSDGKPITSRDFTFFYNLVKANKKAIGGYVPGLFPDNVKSVKIVNARTFQLLLTKAYARDWFTYNQLSFLTPIPQHAWDKTSAGGRVGNADMKASGAQAVFKFLTQQSQNRDAYATNPLWKVVSGPWKLNAFRSDGFAEFVPNKRWRGIWKPRIAKFQELPFTSSDAEVNTLRAGGLDIGILPSSADALLGPLNDQGFVFRAAFPWGFNYMQINFNNPDVGPLFKQLYIRQALESVVDQPSMLKAVQKNLGHLTFGPVPQLPKNPFYSPLEKRNWLDFNTSRAVSLLKSHGWNVDPGGTSTCGSPGNGANQCGAGIAAGTKLSFNVLSLSGCPGCDVQVQTFQSDASKAGININLQDAPFNTVYGGSTRCQPTEASCKWQINYYSGWGYGPVLPTGDALFACNGGSNYGSFCDPELDKLIQKTLTVGGPKTYAAYEARLSHDIPELWLPGGVFPRHEIRKTLRGFVPINPTEVIYPERLYYTK